MENRKVGNILTHYRHVNNLSQQDVAQMLGCNRASYTYYETGKVTPSVVTLIKLADIFKLDVMEFFEEVVGEVLKDMYYNPKKK